MVLTFDYVTQHKENWLFSNRYRNINFLESIRNTGSYDAGFFKLMIPRFLKPFAIIYAPDDMWIVPRERLVNTIAIPDPNFFVAKFKRRQSPGKVNYAGIGSISTLYMQSADLRHVGCILDIPLTQIKISNLATGCYFILGLDAREQLRLETQGLTITYF